MQARHIAKAKQATSSKWLGDFMVISGWNLWTHVDKVYPMNSCSPFSSTPKTYDIYIYNIYNICNNIYIYIIYIYILYVYIYILYVYIYIQIDQNCYDHFSGGSPRLFTHDESNETNETASTTLEAKGWWVLWTMETSFQQNWWHPQGYLKTQRNQVSAIYIFSEIGVCAVQKSQNFKVKCLKGLIEGTALP